MDPSRYRQLFLDESREHLGLLNRELSHLEREGGDVDALFRAAHSLKGMSGSMGYEAIVAVAHALEDVLDRLRKRTLAVTPALAALLFEGVDALGALVAEVEEREAPHRDVAGIAARLRAAASAAPPAIAPEEPSHSSAHGAALPRPAPPPAAAGAAACVAPAEDAGSVPSAEGVLALDAAQLTQVREGVRGGLVPYSCRLRVSRDAAAMAARNFVILGRIARAGVLVAASPTLEQVRGGSGREVVDAVLLTQLPEDGLRAHLLATPELRELRLARLSLDEGGAGEGAPGPALVSQRAAAVERPAGAVPGLADRFVPKRPTTVRVDTRVLDELINIVGELIITRDRLEGLGPGLASRELDADLEHLRTLVRAFQDTIMTVRLMPLEAVTDRLPRLVRDIARASGKEVGFEVEGRGIEMDRAVLEELGDVLIHLVRNAVDHGVEDPEARAAAGKAPKASVRLRAGRERDWFWVRVEDDGRGMDPERIAAAAVARGLVEAGRAASLAEPEKLMLCCLPGVSTAGRVTDISGRGVGMDVVKARVDACGGTLRIDSEPGRGTAVTLRLPLSLAIIRVLLVEAGGREYGLPVSHVVRTGLLGGEGVDWSGGEPLLRHGERLVPLRDLAALLGGAPRDLRSRPGLFLAVSEFSERAAGLVVDRLLGTWEVVVKPLGPPLKGVRGLAGATVVGDGRTVPLLDLTALV